MFVFKGLEAIEGGIGLLAHGRDEMQDGLKQVGGDDREFAGSTGLLEEADVETDSRRRGRGDDRAAELRPGLVGHVCRQRREQHQLLVGVYQAGCVPPPSRQRAPHVGVPHGSGRQRIQCRVLSVVFGRQVRQPGGHGSGQLRPEHVAFALLVVPQRRDGDVTQLRKCRVGGRVPLCRLR
ncbi:hypothetical protein QFZ63_000112 [Streptomyces sp. B3I7]|uniref:hypothetical protein n=1 Tax=Streptomyces sp. B3I7 TaxID=3042269 RepID=UPI0027850C45|nr:hypothetical protein [Streptomyces sp. B3I7]MDQ0808398.1 hypothetical protein [Streptomyces sp. B3I7]